MIFGSRMWSPRQNEPLFDDKTEIHHKMNELSMLETKFTIKKNKTLILDPKFTKTELKLDG